MRARLPLLVGLALLAAGCSQDMGDLEQYALEVKSRTSKNIEPIPQPKPYEPFTYDEVVLEAGATFVGNFLLPALSGDAWVTIRSSALDALPAGKRVGPPDALKMATLQTPNVESTLNAATGAHHYRFAGIRFTGASGGLGERRRSGSQLAALL